MPQYMNHTKRILAINMRRQVDLLFFLMFLLDFAQYLVNRLCCIDKNSTVVGGNDLKVKLRVNPGDYNVVLDCAFINTIADLKKMVTQYSVQVRYIFVSKYRFFKS